MNVLETYDCNQELLHSLFERIIVIGDRVNLPDGIYANTDDELGAVIIQGRFVAELEIYDRFGEGRID